MVKAKKPLINPVDTEGHGLAHSAARIMILFISLAFVSYPAEALTDAEKFVLETALQGTLNVEHDYQRQRGELVGCGLVFTVGIRDWRYKAGGIVLIRGSLNFYSFPGKVPAYVIKIQPVDITIMGDGFLQQDFAPVDFGYFVLGEYTTANKEIDSFQCEKGGYCATINAFENLDMIEAVISGLMLNQMKVAYTREGGQSDVTTKIDLGDGNNGELMPAASQFLQCQIEALNAAVSRQQ